MKPIMKYFAIAIALATAELAVADVVPNSLISDGMVLQRDGLVRFWGTADPGEAVSIKFRGQEARVAADDDGRWVAGLESKEAGGPFALTIAGKNTIAMKDVMVGEVWVCAGESNMEQGLFYATGGPEAMASSANPKLRLYTVPRGQAETPRDDAAGHWAGAAPATTRGFSALGYWFGSRLQKALGVPVGLINASYAGTEIEAWLSWPAIEGLPGPRDKHVDHARMRAEYDPARAAAEAARANHARAVERARWEGRPLPTDPASLGPYRGPSTVYHAMIAPLLNYRIRGVAWSQGESNGAVGRASTYGMLLTALIAQWRADWDQGDFPFLFVQLAPARKKDVDPNVASGLAEVREAQRITSRSVPDTAMVVTTDLGEGSGDLVYRRKKPAGERLAAAALGVAYGLEIESSGPTYEEVSIDGNRAIVRFGHAAGRLSSGDGTLTGFTIAGPNWHFVRAEAGIEGDTVVVSSPKVLMPVAVRYGWSDFPVTNLSNKAGLPASPFRTDQFPLVPRRENTLALKKGAAARPKGATATKPAGVVRPPTAERRR